jgi:N-acetyl-gamma-glutamyl-phosphate reductase
VTAPGEPARFRAAVVGGTGYGGAELIRLLLGHPEVALARVTSIDHVGEPLQAVHLSLPETGLFYEELPLAAAAEGMDVVFLALPHKVTAKLAPELRGVRGAVLDLSGDYRLRDPGEYARFYGHEHPFPEELGAWVYGLPELHREAIRAARRVASPGCFATTIALGLLPLARAGLLGGSVHTVAATGSSGSGAYSQAGTHHPLRASNLKIYRPLEHQHTPEIEQTLRDAAGPGAAELWLDFVPVSAPLTRGILANSFVSLAGDTEPAQVDRLFRGFYGDAAFVRVLGAGPRHAEVVAVKGSMWVELSWTLSPARGGRRQLVVTTALDNLVKGGAGQAVQSMNLILGMPERTGLAAPALWP